MRIVSSGLLVTLLALLFLPNASAADAKQAEANPLALLKSGKYATLEAYYADRQQRYESGSISDEVLYREFRALYEDSPANEQYFNAWVRSFPKSYSARTARGAYYYRMAWFVRGDKTIGKTPDTQLAEMQRYLTKARPDLAASLKLTNKPYLSTLYLLNAAILSDPSDTRRYWFDAGNTIDPGNVLLRQRYMFSLRPRWGGSYMEMRDFLRECERQHVPARTHAMLEIMIVTDLADSRGETASPMERYEMWGEILNLQKTAGGSPSVEAVMRRTRAAWDLKRREEADRGLVQLAGMQVDEAWVLSQIGWMYTQENRQTEAWPILLRAAELSDAWAQFAVGKTTYLGCPELRLPADRTAGLAWIRRAADQHFEEAEVFLESTPN